MARYVGDAVTPPVRGVAHESMVLHDFRVHQCRLMASGEQTAG
jgi:hypothetical protein